MNKLRVLGVSSEGNTTEKFILFNETNNECTILLDRIKHKQTFEYLMNCLRDKKEVDRQELFLELKEAEDKNENN